MPNLYEATTISINETITHLENIEVGQLTAEYAASLSFVINHLELLRDSYAGKLTAPRKQGDNWVAEPGTGYLGWSCNVCGVRVNIHGADRYRAEAKAWTCNCTEKEEG